MPNVKYKIIYSLRVHLLLQKRGFKFETEMKNPQHPHLNCWVYVETTELNGALDEIMGGSKYGR